MQNPIVSMMMNQLKAKNPQAFQTLSQNQNNPIDMLRNTLKNYNPDQLNNYFKQAQMMGFPSEVLEQIKKEVSS